MNGEIGIIGYPSRLGGADTELDHQMRVWSAMGIKMHVVHTGKIDDNLKKMRLEERPGVTIHEPLDWSAVKGMPVISYCNGEFLKRLKDIREHASEIWWANCMCWLFPEEIEAHRRGYIDRFIYQTARVKEQLTGQLKKANSETKGYLIRPYFDASEFTFNGDKERDRFRFCRINREDAAKFHRNFWWLPETFVAPQLKEGHVLGWNDQIEAKVGKPPEYVTAERAGARDVKEVWAKSHVLLHWADPSQTENLPRIGFEAMATGTVIIADNRGGWTEQVIHGETGWLCDNDREFAYLASRMAFESIERSRMAEAARDHLETTWGLEQAKLNWEKFFNE